ncbi:MAG: 3-deoxy-7-phosphoheptulonate synthase [Eubacterium sp.]|nr:3-deoxy-7-phosphoheptulonate synthase [Eubacterium sp.]MBR2559681.1 3-deoxy-7-phosphoheptulonate synthase [Bacillota bacterium]
MITVLKPNTTEDQRNQLIGWFEEQGLTVHVSVGEFQTVLGLVGDTSGVDIDMIRLLDIVADVKRISEPYKKANRKFHPEDSVIDVHGAKCGGGNFAVIAGPCSVESEEQIVEVARRVKAAGATMLRGGAFKPRTSPYAFQGMRAEGLELLAIAKKETGLPIVSEIMNENHLDLFEDVDLIQVGARNMQNFELLKALGHIDKPILLKRGLANTLEELLMSAEYIMAGGNENIILCERGIRTFDHYTRNTLDISAVPGLHEMTHLPVIIDPSHSTGKASFVRPAALAATACGADGLMIEVHNDPKKALCDGAQSLTPDQFDEVMTTVRKVREAVL